MNKLKGSSSAVKMKYLLFVFAAAVLVSLPTRVYQLLALVDTTNGFFKESDVTIPVLYGVVIVFGLLFSGLVQRLLKAGYDKLCASAGSAKVIFVADSVAQFAILALSMAALVGGTYNAFIYFQF